MGNKVYVPVPRAGQPKVSLTCVISVSLLEKIDALAVQDSTRRTTLIRELLETHPRLTEMTTTPDDDQPRGPRED